MNTGGEFLDRLAIWLFAILFWICVAAVVGLIALVQFGGAVAFLATAAVTAFLALLFLALQGTLGKGR
jgi:hypothetical protein